MVYHKRYMVTLTPPRLFLSTLPQFASSTKSRIKKVAEKKSVAGSAAGSKTASPAPDTKAKDIHAKITKPKNIQKAKSWLKKPLQFKTFSGFKVKYVTWRQKETRKDTKTKAEKEREKAEKEKIKEANAAMKTEAALAEPETSAHLPKIEESAPEPEPQPKVETEPEIPAA